jgi:hypothetical protein
MISRELSVKCIAVMLFCTVNVSCGRHSYDSSGSALASQCVEMVSERGVVTGEVTVFFELPEEEVAGFFGERRDAVRLIAVTADALKNGPVVRPLVSITPDPQGGGSKRTSRVYDIKVSYGPKDGVIDRVTISKNGGKWKVVDRKKIGDI